MLNAFELFAALLLEVPFDPTPAPAPGALEAAMEGRNIGISMGSSKNESITFLSVRIHLLSVEIGGKCYGEEKSLHLFEQRLGARHAHGLRPRRPAVPKLDRVGAPGSGGGLLPVCETLLADQPRPLQSSVPRNVIRDTSNRKLIWRIVLIQCIDKLSNINMNT